MSSGVQTLLKVLGGAAITAAIVIALLALISTFMPETLVWFKGQIGM